jgi:hypothetical protein
VPKVQINYKSGHSMVITCDEFEVEGRGFSYFWKNAKPRPLQFGADDVESVWEL